MLRTTVNRGRRLWLGLVVAAGCDLAEKLEGEPCAVEKDCWHTQECARTAEEKELALPGLCLPEGTGCVAGQQLGCACDPNNWEANCSLVAAPLEIEYPAMICDEARRVCVVEPEDSEEQP